jgi:hypothetical protein
MKLLLGEISPEQSYQIGNYVIPYRDIIQPDGLIRVEMYRDQDTENPTAYSSFRARMNYLQNEYSTWKTLVIDSVTFMELAARKNDEKLINPLPPGKTKATVKKGDGVDPRQWFGASTDALEEMLCIRFAALPMNVVIVCHINEKRNDVSGEILRMPFAPGRLSDRKLLNAAYQEQYYMSTGRDTERNRTHLLKTQNDGQWAATTQIDAPDPCFPHYESLWQNWPIERLPIHALVYGDFGVGKSQFASSFPKPMLVFMFDGVGKEIPYMKRMDFGGV